MKKLILLLAISSGLSITSCSSDDDATQEMVWFNYEVSPSSSINTVGSSSFSTHKAKDISGGATTFKFKYELVTGAGSILMDGEDLQANVWYDVAELFNTSFESDQVGETQIKFSLKNSDELTQVVYANYATASVGSPTPKINGSVYQFYRQNESNIINRVKFSLDHAEQDQNNLVNIKVYNGDTLAYDGPKKDCYFIETGRIYGAIPASTYDLTKDFKDLKIVLTYEETGTSELNVSKTSFVTDWRADKPCEL